MVKRILNSQNQQESQESTKRTGRIELDMQSHVQIYPRVSTPEQKKNVSAEMQQDKTFALNFGWSEDLIILDTRDLGVSGQLKMEDRLAFNDMNRRASNGIVKTIIAAQVDRLFRDRWEKNIQSLWRFVIHMG
jgi:DNA invertase Pin-like site-specific DNA recombinase